ncbi:GntR family transcriptional regulator [Aestuariivirga litoralis]|uniref:GntR family transcriptional regulator n=1 Tax=Aestuariivirga litoralis TaxID=2650924 RepID=UPI0018C72E75|nr:GntR family transcriptional regulator [Aestuariivirga litoralis]
MNAKVVASQGYRRVRDDVLRRIQSGIWKPGVLVPGEIELAQEFGVARATANKAMLELVEQGYLERKRKSGTRVRAARLRAARFTIPLIREEIEANARYGYRLLSCVQETSDTALRERLGLTGKAKLLHVICLHLADDAPHQVEERWINLHTLPEAAQADFSTVSPNEWLIDRVPFNDVELDISAIMPPPHVHKLIGKGTRAPSLLTERTTWLNGKSVTYLRLYFKPGYKLATQY